MPRFKDLALVAIFALGAWAASRAHAAAPPGDFNQYKSLDEVCREAFAKLARPEARVIAAKKVEALKARILKDEKLLPDELLFVANATRTSGQSIKLAVCRRAFQLLHGLKTEREWVEDNQSLALSVAAMRVWSGREDFARSALTRVIDGIPQSERADRSLRLETTVNETFERLGLPPLPREAGSDFPLEDLEGFCQVALTAELTAAIEAQQQANQNVASEKPQSDAPRNPDKSPTPPPPDDKGSAGDSDWAAEAQKRLLEQFIAEIEQRVKRPLSPSERIEAEQWFKDGRSVGDSVQALATRNANSPNATGAQP